MTDIDAKFSPGPWRLVDGETETELRSPDSREVVAILDAGGNFIAGHDYFNVFGDNQANDLRLMLAGPELFAALRGMLEYAAHIEERWGDAETKAARAAIAKVTGTDVCEGQ